MGIEADSVSQAGYPVPYVQIAQQLPVGGATTKGVDPGQTALRQPTAEPLPK